MRWIGLAAAMVGVVLSGCASVPPRVESTVAVFHQLPVDAVGSATYAVLPWKKENEGSLEFETYAQQLTATLQSKGMKVVPSGTPANYILFFDYGIDNGRTETSTYSVPQWGVTGYSGSTTTGTVNSFGGTSYLQATTTATPTYGVTGYNQVTSSSRVFRRFVNVDIVDVKASTANGSPKKVYQGQLRSEGSCGTLTPLMPVFIQALFSEFPGQSGSSRKLTLPWSGQC